MGWKKEGAGGVGEGSGGGGVRAGFWVARKGGIYRDARRRPRPWAGGFGKQRVGTFPARFAPGGPGGPTKLGSHRLRPGRQAHIDSQRGPHRGLWPREGVLLLSSSSGAGPREGRFLLSSSSGAGPREEGGEIFFSGQSSLPAGARGPGREGNRSIPLIFLSVDFFIH